MTIVTLVSGCGNAYPGLLWPPATPGPGGVPATTASPAVHPRATTTAARVSRNGPNDCEMPCNIAIVLPFYGSECHSSDKGSRPKREGDSPATAEGRPDVVASLLPVRRPPPGDGRRRITAESRSNIDEYPASAR